jgi:membrane protease YdiL (CAAX protease family)
MALAGQFVEVPLSQFVAKQLGINADALSAPAVIVGELVSLAAVLLVTGVAAGLEQRRIDEYGLRIDQPFGKPFWNGTLAGVVMVAFVGGAMVLVGAMRVDGFALHGLEAANKGLPWLAGMLLLGVSEEYLFRGYALQSLWRSLGFWPAALITSALFVAAHLSKPHENAIDAGIIFLIGLVLCLSVRQTGSLWWAVGWHSAFDFGQFFLLGTRNGGESPVGHLLSTSFPGSSWLTGGELGTEASAFMLPAALAVFIYVTWFLCGKSAENSSSAQF